MNNKEEVLVCDPYELVKDLADNIGIHQLYAIARELRGEPVPSDELMRQNEELKSHISYLQERLSRQEGLVEGLKFALRCNGVSGGDVG